MSSSESVSVSSPSPLFPKSDRPLELAVGSKEEAPFFDLDEALSQLKSGIKSATSFVQRHPLLVLTAVCAVALVGVWAVSALRKRAS